MNGIRRYPGPVGVVVIGRNEGERLKSCLRSLHPESTSVVYVDSGSSDDSVAFCRAAGAVVIELDLSQPFTAARARNLGFRRLIREFPHVRYVQFVDGDCRLAPEWMAAAAGFLDDNPAYAAACGRRREIAPQASVYNALCDIEWNTPSGDAKSCGGDVMIRVQPLAAAGGYRDALIAGEEPELCYRLRRAGWKIRRLDLEMTLHDAQLSRFSQWWKRSRRAGYACALGVLLHGRSEEKYYVKPLLSMLLWGGALPAAALIPAALDLRCALVLLAYPLQYLRLALRGPAGAGGNPLWALFTLLGKFPQCYGALQCFFDRSQHRTAMLIEYK